MTNGFVPGPPTLPTAIRYQGSPPPDLPPDRHIRRGQLEYWHALQALLPNGIAWPRWFETSPVYDENGQAIVGADGTPLLGTTGATIMRVVYGLAGIMGFVDGRAADLLERESDPRTTVEMLDSWETAWGLPDPCWPHPGTVAERQRMLVLKMTMLGGQSRQHFIDVARFLGYDATITENRPFMVGVDRCGDNRAYDADAGTLADYPARIGHPEMRFAWTMHINQVKLVWFRAGQGQAGIDHHLTIRYAQDLECLIRRWRPAHTAVMFDYSGIGDPFAGAQQYDVTLRSAEPVTLRDGTPVIDKRVLPFNLYAGDYSLASPQFTFVDMPPYQVTSSAPAYSTASPSFAKPALTTTAPTQRS